MLNAVEFQARIKNGVIQIPEIYSKELDGESVKVIVMKQTKQAAVDIIDELTEHPVEFDWPPLTREEIYNREL